MKCWNCNKSGLPIHDSFEYGSIRYDTYWCAHCGELREQIKKYLCTMCGNYVFESQIVRNDVDSCGAPVIVCENCHVTIEQTSISDFMNQLLCLRCGD